MATKNETTTPSTAKQVNILGSKVLFKGRWLQFSRTSYIDEGDGTTVRVGCATQNAIGFYHHYTQHCFKQTD